MLQLPKQLYQTAIARLELCDFSLQRRGPTYTWLRDECTLDVPAVASVALRSYSIALGCVKFLVARGCMRGRLTFAFRLLHGTQATSVILPRGGITAPDTPASL